MLFVVFYLFLQHFCFDPNSFDVLWRKRVKFLTFLTLECWSWILEDARRPEIHLDQEADPPWSFSSQKLIWIRAGPSLEDILRMERVWPSPQCQFHLSLSSSSSPDLVWIFYSVTCPVVKETLYKEMPLHAK